MHLHIKLYKVVYVDITYDFHFTNDECSQDPMRSRQQSHMKQYERLLRQAGGRGVQASGARHSQDPMGSEQEHPLGNAQVQGKVAPGNNPEAVEVTFAGVFSPTCTTAATQATAVTG